MMPSFAMRKIVKRFPGVVANCDVDLTIEPGEIHALLGENGAGKSTLMQILYGFHSMDSGSILIDDKPVEIRSSKDAIALGIGMVHQEFMLVRRFSVVENTVLGLKGFNLVAKPRTTAAQSEQPASIWPSILSRRCSTCRLECNSALRSSSCSTATPACSFSTNQPPSSPRTRRSSSSASCVDCGTEGRSIVIVTHKLQEIIDLADRVTVMRDGRVVAAASTRQTSEQELARLMVGRDVNLRTQRAPIERGRAVLRIDGLHVRDEAGQEKVRGLSLDVHAGEIVGIAGVDGNGQSQLAEAIMHLRPAHQGSVFLDGRDVTRLTVAHHHALGLSYVPADRRHVGAITEMPVAENAILGSQRKYTRGLFLDRQRIREHAEKLIARFGVRAYEHQHIGGQAIWRQPAEADPRPRDPAG